MESYRFSPIAYIQSCFKEKFGIPRQAGLISAAEAVIKFESHLTSKESFKGLEGFSHLWVLFVFHAHHAKTTKYSIRPPRLGGSKKIGVLASRSPHRPNPIGISVVKLEKVTFFKNNRIELLVSGVDFLDGTPVLDIKPYIEYVDSVPNTKSGWADEPIIRTPVQFSNSALQSIHSKSRDTYPKLKELITGILELDPRPAFQKRRSEMNQGVSHQAQYGFNLFTFDVRWEIRDKYFYVLDVINRTQS